MISGGLRILAQLEFCTEFCVAVYVATALNCSGVCGEYILIFFSEISVSAELNSSM